MDRDFRDGRLAIDFAATPFHSPWALLADALRVFFANFGTIAGYTLLVYLPGHLLYQAAASMFDMPSNGILSAVLLEVLDLVLSALVTPMVGFALVQKMRGAPSDGAFRWGWRQWLRMLVNLVKVEVTVLLYGALLIVPGIIAMVRLTFVPVIVAIEADGQHDAMGRSRALSEGRFWRILLVFLPLTILELVVNYLFLGRIASVDGARVLFAGAESLLAVAGQVATVASLLMYLGIVAPPEMAVQRKTARR